MMTKLCFLLVITIAISDSLPVSQSSAGDGHHISPDASAIDLIVDANKENGVIRHLFEGDIRRSRHRNAVRIDQWIWKDNKIPYTVKTSGISLYGQQLIKESIAEYNKVQSCIRWIPRTSENDYVVIKDGTGCHSSIGRDGGPQDLVIGGTCYYKGVIMHEMTHAAGFFHEQSRYDRDKYIQVNWENIVDGKSRDFTKQSPNIMDTFDTPYDYGSLMHYGSKTFSKNSKPTLTPLYDPHGTMGQRSGFSDLDIWKIEKLYGCEKGKPPLPIWMILDKTTESSTSKSTTPATTPPSTSTPSSTSKSTTPAITPPSTAPSTLPVKCEEEKTLPAGTPGTVQNFEVVVIESTLRVFWDPPCTRVPLKGYILTYTDGQQQSTITIHPERHTHYIYTASHPGRRYEMTISALSETGSGPVSSKISTYAACGHDIVLPENGTYSSIHSPFFLQEHYEPNVACQWNVKAPEGQRLKISFDALNLAGTGTCDGDFLMINSDRFCDTVPKKGYYMTAGNEAKIVFLSQAGPVLKQGGFNIFVAAVDYKPKEPTIINQPGFIGISWQPPDDVEGANYNYVIKYQLIPEQQQEVVTLGPNVLHFGFPTGHHIGRLYEIELSTVIGSKEGRSHKMIIRSACGRNVIVDQPGYIHNPPTLGTYEPDVVCRWHLQGKSGKHIRFTFSDLDLETSTNCINDFIEVESIGRYCSSSQVHGSLTSLTANTTLTFRSNGSVERRGFNVHYEVGPVILVGKTVDRNPENEVKIEITSYNDDVYVFADSLTFMYSNKLTMWVMVP